MQQLISDLRRMTAVGSDQYEVDGVKFWSDDDLERILQRRVSARLIQVPLELFPTRTLGGGLVFEMGRAVVSGTLDVETAVVTSFSGAELAGETTIHDDGRIEFSENQVSSVPVISGLCFDLNAAAADVLEDWASALKLGYDIKSGDAELARSQRHEMLLEQATTYRKKAVAGTGQMGRSDLRTRYGGSQRIGAALKAFDRLGNPG